MRINFFVNEEIVCICRKTSQMNADLTLSSSLRLNGYLSLILDTSNLKYTGILLVTIFPHLCAEKYSFNFKPGHRWLIT